MDSISVSGGSDEHRPDGDCPLNAGQKRYHRVASARRAQGVSLDVAAQRLGWSRQRTKQSEVETSDLKISELMQWQAALGVPLEDLLFESEVLSRPVLDRARLLRLMKTTVTLDGLIQSGQAKALVGRLIDQLTEIMPELRGVRAWPIQGASPVARFGITAERIFNRPN